MKEERSQAATRAKVREKRESGLKNDLKMKREAGRLGVMMLYLVGIVVGMLSLSAAVSALLQVLR